MSTTLFTYSFLSGPNEDIPVKVTGNVKNGFEAEFLPLEVGVQTILVEYNGVAVGGTPFFSKAFDSNAVAVSDIPKATPGKTVTFAGNDDDDDDDIHSLINLREGRLSSSILSTRRNDDLCEKSGTLHKKTIETLLFTHQPL